MQTNLTNMTTKFTKLNLILKKLHNIILGHIQIVKIKHCNYGIYKAKIKIYEIKF